jgi:hypothetical protein
VKVKTVRSVPSSVSFDRTATVAGAGFRKQTKSPRVPGKSGRSGAAIPPTTSRLPNVKLSDLSCVQSDLSELPRWQELDSLLLTFSPTTSKAVVRDQNRRWELVSAYQKSIRRADVQMALKIVSAFDSIPQHRGYLWHRLLTTVAEDVGPADPVLVAFALYCAVVFRKAPAEAQQHALAYLTVQMCSLRHRSRVWCSQCVISEKARECTTLSDQAKSVVQTTAQIPAPQTSLHAWLKQKSWMTEGMSKYAVLDSLWELVPVDTQPEAGIVLYGLPSYAYDMHTRVGRRALHASVAVPEVQQFLAAHRPTKKLDVLGWALFYVEGGRIAGELASPLLAQVELEIAFGSLGLYDQAAMDALQLMRWMVASGKLNQSRDKAIIENYPDRRRSAWPNEG